ncbi:MAG: RDD family protein [Prevotella sp.]|nr:RDD family protein [Prevotella sp.]
MPGILTGQYVHIEQPVASVGDRMVAQIADWLVLISYSAVYFSLFARFINSYMAMVVILLLPILFYTPACEMFFHGQTLGKKLTNIRVVMADGMQPSLGSYLLRWLSWIIDGPTMSFLGLLVMVVSKNNQRLGDMAAGTVVIKQQDYRKVRVSLDDYDYLTGDYTPRYAAAADLSLEQIELIRRTLGQADANAATRTAMLAEKVSQRLGITPGEPSAALFLQRIVSDYQYYALEELPG